MKIGIDCRLWNEGGVGRYLRNLVWQLARLDKQNQYTLFFYRHAPIEIGKQFKVKISRAKWHSLAEQTEFFTELKAGNFDLVHFPYFSHPILYNRPFVTTIHDITVKQYATGQATTRSLPFYYLKRLGYFLVLRHAVSQAKRIIVPSQAVAKDLERHFSSVKNKLSVTYEGLGIELTKAKPEAISLSNSDFWLYVGNFYPHKNISLLLEAISGLDKIKEQLVLVGPRDLFFQRLKTEIKRLRLEKKVTLLPAVNDGQLVWLYQHTEALVLPSLFEGFGLPVLEAAYFGCPLVLADIPVFREIAPPKTKFFDPHSAASLQQSLLNFPKRRQFQTPKNYFDRFSFAKMTKETLAVYRQAI
jgi:glycosyltransferase involved in cell wall biosynthesis